MQVIDQTETDSFVRLKRGDSSDVHKFDGTQMLFVANDGEWVDVCGAQSWDEAGGECDAD